MKIYRGKHQIEQVIDVDTRKHMPLSYIDIPRENNLNVSLVPSIKFKEKPEMVKVMPYTYYNSSNVKLFDKDKNLLDNGRVLQEDNKGGYYFFPSPEDIEEVTNFNYSILYKRDGIYRGNTFYDIPVGIEGFNSNKELYKKMLPIFGKSNQVGISPSNVIVNSGDNSESTFQEIADKEIVFIETDDGKHYKNTKNRIDFEKFEKENKNIWLLCGTLAENQYCKIDKKEKSVSNLAVENAFYGEKIESDFILEKKTDNTFRYNKIATGDQNILLVENINKNFIVITPSDIINNIMKNAKAIHEVILYIHIISYFKGQTINSWIHSYLPDFEFKKNSLQKKMGFSDKIKMYENASVMKADISDEKVGFDISKDIIRFEYKKEPNYVKDKTNISIYTHHKNIMILKDKDYAFEMYLGPTIDKYEYADGTLNVDINPIIHSTDGTYMKDGVKYSTDIDVSVIKSFKIFLSFDNNIPVFSEEPGKDVLATLVIDIENDEKLIMTDIRRLGGGLKKNRKKNYNLLDIGSSYGRPLRKGGAAIITLPTKLKEHEDKIRSAIDQHKIADRHYILIFRDGGDMDD